jgi:uncharacterized protein YjbI with pentapeptide repeats
MLSMANEEHVALLNQGVAAWDAWYHENANIPPDLSEAILGGADLSGVDLSGANLFMADLSGAILVKANLSGADLSGANLSKARLNEAVLNSTMLVNTDLTGEAAILSRIRSDVTPRSNWANDRRTFRVSRPIEMVVLNCWVTETKDTSC